MNNVNPSTSLRASPFDKLRASRKKLLFLVTQSEMGGAQRYVYEIASNLDFERYDIAIAAGQGDSGLFQKIINPKSEALNKSQIQNPKTIALKYLKRTPWPWDTFLAIAEILNLLKKEKPDILFLCSTTAGLLGSIAASLSKLLTTNYKLLTIYRIGGWAFKDPRSPLLNFLILLAEKIAAPLKDIIVVNNEEDLRLALKYGIAPRAKLAKIYNGVDSNKLNFLPREEARRTVLRDIRGELFSVKLIGTVANFYKTKGLEYLIDAASIINSKFIVIGDGRERPKLEALIKKFALENKVILLGRIPDAYKYLKAFDIFILPSLKEGFPWIILEAMAAKVPIVATKVGAIPEIIEDGKEGFLVEPKDSRALAEKIKEIINNPALGEQLSISAKEKLGKFSLENMLSQTEALLN